MNRLPRIRSVRLHRIPPASARGTCARALAPLLGLALAGAAHAASPDADVSHTEIKVTLGQYQYEHGSGQDLNVRWAEDGRHTWIGAYGDGDFGMQARAGWDDSYALTDMLSVQPSLQVATRGFVGGSFNVQAGNDVFVVAGLGRTNLKPYFNLNFDPNDAYTLGGGFHTDDGTLWSTTLIADNRLHTGQRDWHWAMRAPLSGGRRLTFDVMYKRGDSDAGFIRAWGWSATWDEAGWFVRLARDPKQNFSAVDAWRLSGGWRF